MDQGLIPARYAKALYKLALEDGKSQRLYKLMSQLAGTFAAEPRLQTAVANPFVPSADKTRLLSEAAGAEAGDKLFADFLKLLYRNKRIEFVRDMALKYLDLYRKANNIYLVKIITASALPQSEIDRIHHVVEEHLKNATIEYSQEIDPDLIGGFVININSERLDASLDNQLKQLRLKLLSNSNN